MRNRKIIIAGGGTGGHIFPALAIANAIRELEPGTDFLFVGAKGRMEMEKVPDAGYRIVGLDITGFDRQALWKNIRLPFKLVKSFMQVRRVFRDFPADAVIGVGGYSSFPVLRYAQSIGLPTFIHESNSFAGKSNILLGKKSTLVFVAAGGMERFFPLEKIRITGNPVRRSIAGSTMSREDGLHFFGLDPRKKTVLSLGGSLGAKSINEAVAAGLDAISEAGLQLIWQTGKPFAEKAAEAVKNRKGMCSSSFIREMQYAYAAADVVISRAGAMSVAEICVMGKAAVFVPFPLAAEDHQTANAMHLVAEQAGICVPDKEAGTDLIPAVLSLANDDKRRRDIENCAKSLATMDADMTIAQAVLQELDKWNG